MEADESSVGKILKICLRSRNPTHGYVLQDPVNFIDPSGLDATDWFNWSGGRIPIVDGPTNGNWGGKNWSGSEGGGGTGAGQPTDSGDECYMDHDICYDKCGNKKQCDKNLVSCLKKLPLDPAKWPRPPRSGTEKESTKYRNGAYWWFGGAS